MDTRLTSMGYHVGDRVYIFIPGGTWGHDTYTIGTVRKITKSGQLTVEREGEAQVNRRLRRFNARGHELAVGYDRPAYLLRRDEQDAYAQTLATGNSMLAMRRRHTQVLEQLANITKSFDPVDDPAGTAAQLRSWADKVEAYRPPVLAPLNPE